MEKSDKISRKTSQDLKKENRHILVIGGAGYIGSVLVRKLLAKGYKTRVIDNLIYKNGSSISSLLENNCFSFVFGDYGNPEILGKALEGVTDVILLAALVGDPICKKYPELAEKINLDYPKKLVQLMQGKNLRRLIFTSTCSNYGLQQDDTPADENSVLNPLSVYAETKVKFEQHLIDNLLDFDFAPVVLRLSTAFGLSPRMRFDLTISEFTHDLAIGKGLLVFDEDTWRPYCNVSDISEAILKTIEVPEEKVSGQVFNIGSDNNNYTKKMIVNIIRKHIKNAAIFYQEGGFDSRNYRVSFNKVRSILDIRTQFTAEDSIVNLINAIDNKLFDDVDSRKDFYGNYYIDEYQKINHKTELPST